MKQKKTYRKKNTIRPQEYYLSKVYRNMCDKSYSMGGAQHCGMLQERS